MINFIKDAVTAVSGIKSFLFNTDYRNNFDLQNVEFPCCVLTPIVRTNYDLKNIIRESAELQLSVVDLAPYEYTGDNLYAINKRCSDLALQVIANLQVKSKLDKELTFEFILPSGDELISGVMCNLQCTMKQGSCIGAPSYIEVIVQPVKRENITSNGKHVISPNSGFTAMKEVEVDVNVDLKGSLQDKQVTITENGTQTIVADEGFDGLNSVEVVSDVYEPFANFADIGYTLQDNNDLASYFNEQIKISEEYLYKYNNGDVKDFKDLKSIFSPKFKASSNMTLAFYSNTYTLFVPELDLSEVTDMKQWFHSSAIRYFGNTYIPNVKYTINTFRGTSLAELSLNLPSCINIDFAAGQCYRLQKVSIIAPLLKSMAQTFYEDAKLVDVHLEIGNTCTNARQAFIGCSSLETLHLLDFSNVMDADSIFLNCSNLTNIEGFIGLKTNISFSSSPLLTSLSIHNVILQALGNITITLHVTSKENWEASEYYEQDLAVLKEKGITIA